MKNEIQKAYQKAAPERGELVRMYERVLDRAEAAPEHGVRHTRPLRRLTLAAAVVAMATLLASVGYAAYQRWTLPAPTTYEPGEGGIYREHGRNDYQLSTLESTETAAVRPGAEPETEAPEPETKPGTTEPTQTEPLTDEALIRKGLALLTRVGMLDVQPEQLTVVRQENLFWGREEAELSLDRGELKITVTYNAETGKFLGLHGADWQLEGSTACDTEAEAAALAQRFYEALPVEQGYIMTQVEQYDEQYWSYDFCREVEPGVFNHYEMVRVAINPVSGRLTGCVVFYVPLLDDHEPGQERISQEQAEQIAQNSLPELLEGMELVRAEQAIGLPNWNYTEYAGSPNRRASQVSRWAWALHYERPNSKFTEQLVLLVDCYTGEILGGDSTK